MMWGVQLDDYHHGPAEYAEIDAATLTEAWVLACRRHHKTRRVMVVFSLTGPYRQAVRLDYSAETGTGDPH